MNNITYTITDRENYETTVVGTSSASDSDGLVIFLGDTEVARFPRGEWKRMTMNSDTHALMLKKYRDLIGGAA